MKLLVSACLLGCACRYDGKSKPCDSVIALEKEHTLIPFCPEIYGGLPTPRVPSEVVGDAVINRDGKDVTAEYVRGAEESLAIAKALNCDAAILKSKSPSCGKGEIYDGSFSATLKSGNGITASLFIDAGIPVFSEKEIDILIAQK